MKREDITKLFEGATDEQISALLDINSRDIGKVKSEVTNTQTRVAELEEQLMAAGTTIQALEATKGDAAALQAEIDRFRQAEQERQQAEQQATQRAALEKRFDAVVGQRKFLHEYVRKGVLESFEAALAEDVNKGLGDQAIFDTLTKDAGCFASQNPPAPNMPGMGDTTITISDKASFLKLPTVEQLKYKNEHNTEYRQLFGLSATE